MWTVNIVTTEIAFHVSVTYIEPILSKLKTYATLHHKYEVCNFKC